VIFFRQPQRVDTPKRGKLDHVGFIGERMAAVFAEVRTGDVVTDHWFGNCYAAEQTHFIFRSGGDVGEVIAPVRASRGGRL
jgi:hypothetical protein